jgi:large repetitive protein
LDVGALVSVSGNGAILADGGSARSSAWHGSGGGGGRIAIYHEILDSAVAEHISVKGGIRGHSNSRNGEPGTIYLQAKEAPPYIYSIDIPAFSNAVIGSIAVEFSVPIDANTVDVSDAFVTDHHHNTIYPISVEAVSDKTFRFFFPGAFGEGIYTLNVGPNIFAVNGGQMDQNRNGTGGEADDVYQFTFVVDLQDPAPVTVTAKLAPEINTSNTTTYTLSGGREDQTSVWINGEQAVSLGSGSWNASVTLPQGQTTLTIFARDAAGNQSEAITVIVDVDSIAPTISSPIPTHTSAIATVPNTISVRFVETGSGLNLVQSSFVVTRNSTQVSGSLTQEGDRVFFTPSMPFIEGQYTIRPRLVDNYGNQSSQPTYNFLLDYTPPPAPVLNEYPANTAINIQTFSGTKEAGSRIFLDGQQVVSGTSSTNWSYTKSLEFGDNSFVFTSRDSAGNVSQPVIVNIRYDDQAPGAVDFVVNAEGKGTELTVAWPGYNEVANGNDIASYRVYLATHSYSHIDQANLVTQVPGGTKSAKLTGLERGTTYYLSVVAVNTQGLLEANVTPVSATPLDTQPPAEISSLLVVPGTNTLQLSWLPSANTDGDLAGYRINYMQGGESRTQTLSLTDIGNSSSVTHTLSGLNSATAHHVSVSAIDHTGNASVGLSNPAVTLLPNPQNLQGDALAGRADLSWAAVAPYELVKHYALYRQASDYTSVAGMTPVLIVPKGEPGQQVIQRAIAGLTNNETTYIAVTTVNLSDGQDSNVVTLAVTSQEDTEGPVITQAVYLQGNETLEFNTSPILSKSGIISINATDESGISRILLSLNGSPLANILGNSTGNYRHSINLVQLPDGQHSLKVQAYDSLDNLTEETYSFTVALGAPEAPVITTPAANSSTNQPTLALAGTSIQGTRVRVLVGGEVATNDVAVNSQGLFSATITLEEGENTITAEAQYLDRGDWSVASVGRIVTLNTQTPNAPSGVVATAREQGQVHIGWNAVVSANSHNQVKGYNLYRSVSSFSDRNAEGVFKVNSNLITPTSYTDLVIEDGQYVYAVSAVNEANNESALSANVQATVDSTGPKILEVVYTPKGQFDPATGRMAPGIVQVEARFDEPLRNKPYFAIVPNGGVPITVDLSKSFSDDKRYTGQFQITNSTPSGMAYVVMSAYDNAGNRGTEVLQGATLQIDTDGPEVTELLLNPNEPLKVDEIEGLSVDVSIRLNDELTGSDIPQLIPLVDLQPVPGYEQGIPLYRDTQSVEGTPRWLGTFEFPNSVGQDANGQPIAATLTFNYSAKDDLNNVATRIHGKSSFQVYQGDLPPLPVPQNLTAKARPGGKVQLNWSAVSQAHAYVVYRQGPNDSELVEIQRAVTTELENATDIDGTYLYAVASVRRENQQESASAPSQTVSVRTNRVAPGAPRNFTLELNGAGIVSRWDHPLENEQGNPQIMDGVRYNLYRLALPEGEQVSDTSELTPIQTGIPQPIALDSEPSETDHSYFVTTVDAAGNESVPSETLYLNYGLLPVNRLNVVLNENGFPAISWRHSGQAISHYRVYRDNGVSEPVLLTPTPISHAGSITSYTDATYNGGQASKGAHTQVRYTVVAVDNFSVESLGHSILLPALSVSLLEQDTRLNRGIMNRVIFRVDNKGSEAISGLRLHVAVIVDGKTHNHQSESFSIEAGSFAQVPVIVGGHAKLDGIADLRLRIEHKPRQHESVNIHQSYPVLVADSALLATINAEDFTRGSNGKATFTLENTSDVETEILMARSNGNAASNEVRLVLEDMQGNVLTVQPVQQFTGGVITIANGQTLARIAPGASFTSAPITIAVPLAAPDRVRLRLVIDKLHYHSGRDTHVTIGGTGSRTELTLSETPYYAEITEVTPDVVYGKDQTVTITGQAFRRSTGQPMANVPVRLVFTEPIGLFLDEGAEFRRRIGARLRRRPGRGSARRPGR